MVEISFLKPFLWVSTSACVGFLLEAGTCHENNNLFAIKNFLLAL